MSVCVLNKRESQLRDVLSAILTETKGNLQFRKSQFDKAVMTQGYRDKRTLNNWWDFLWKLEYITQSDPGQYQLSVKKLLELELEYRETNQTQLTETCTLTHTNLKPEASP